MIKEYFRTKFLRSKYSALDGKTTICFEEQSESDQPFRILLTPEGMQMEGKMQAVVITEADLQDFAKLISDAWQEHRAIAPKLVKTLSGH